MNTTTTLGALVCFLLVLLLVFAIWAFRKLAYVSGIADAAFNQRDKALDANDEAVQARDFAIAEKNAWLASTARLWRLLDDIDTLDDACRNNHMKFRARVREKQRERFDVADFQDDGAFVLVAERPEEPRS